MTRYLRSEFRTCGRQQAAITAGSKAGASPVHPLRLESCRPRLVDELWRQGCVDSVPRDAPHTNTPWGTFNPLILDPIWMVLAATAVQITAILDLVDRDAEDRKPLYYTLHRLSAQIPYNMLCLIPNNHVLLCPPPSPPETSAERLPYDRNDS